MMMVTMVALQTDNRDCIIIQMMMTIAVNTENDDDLIGYRWQ